MTIRANGSGGISPRPVRVLSVPDSHPISVRFLGPILGLVTHWHTGKSVPCLGETRCPPSIHRARTFWKGYSAIESWDMACELWIPAVLEVTEALDHILHGRALRGEIWLLSRVQRGKKGQVVGVYSETLDDAKLRAPFSLLPVLERFYHVSALEIGIPNPVPRQVFLEPAEGTAPKLLSELSELAPEDQETTREAREGIREQLRKMRASLGLRGTGDRPGSQPGHPETNGKGVQA